jgi:PAS domain S-box-containing protein
VGYCAVLLTAYQLADSVAFLDIFSGYLQYLPLCLGGALTLWIGSRGRSGLHRKTRRSLTLLVVGLALFALGMIGYTWSHLIERMPFGSAIMGDLFYLPGYVVMLAALLSLPTRSAGAYRGWQFALDTSVVLVGAGLTMWYLVVRPTLTEESQGFDLFVRFAYPALGLGFLLALNALALRGGPVDRSGAFRLIGLGVICYVVADGAYQVLYYSGSQPSPITERLNEATYTLSYLLWVGAGLKLMHSPRVLPRKDSVLRTQSLSPLPLMVAVGVVALLTAVAFLPWNPDTSPLILGLVALTIVLVARLGFTARQNRILLAQQVQQQGDARVAALVRHASDLIMVTESDARIRFASPSLRWTLGRSPDELIGSWLGVMVHSDDRLALAEAIDNAKLASHARNTATLRLVHADGTARECEVVITDLSGEPAVQGLVFVARDLTERRALESRLHQAQKMEAVGRLAGGIAHDFNNVLTTVLAETELLLDAPGRSADDRDALLTVKHAGHQAAALTRQLLAFARQQVPSARSVDLVELVASTVRMFGHSASAITVERRIQDELPAAWADPNQISQVLLNLLLNARDAMPTGGTITVSLRTEEIGTPFGEWALEPTAGRYVVLDVMDEGVGMEPTALRRAFEPFFSTKASGHGTGLGLPTVLSTIEKHRGGLRVASEPGLGTTVTVLLPVSRSLAIPEPLSEPAHQAVTPRGRERILLVDDEEPVRDVTRRILERLGYEVELASGAEQARRVVAVTGCPDLLVTDVIMPGESGAQLAESLLMRCPGLPVLFISGFTGDELQRQGTLRPGTILLQKPYTPQELGEYVRGVLDGDWAPAGVGTGEIASAVRS